MTSGQAGRQERLRCEYESFRFMADWLHAAILEVVNLKNFDGTFAFIDRHLDHGGSKAVLKSAVGRLVRLKLLTQETPGKFTRASKAQFLFDQQTAHKAVRGYHGQMLEKAAIALNTQSVEERDFRASTVSIRSKDLARAREIFKRAHDAIVELNADGFGDDVYQVQTQIFRLTKKVGSRK